MTQRYFYIQFLLTGADPTTFLILSLRSFNTLVDMKRRKEHRQVFELIKNCDLVLEVIDGVTFAFSGVFN